MVSEKQVKFYRKWENWILPLLFTLALLLFTSLRFDYYYSLNDDVLMKDILAGVYTGVPESRNVQMLYPLSLLLSLDRKSTRLNSSHSGESRMPSSA